MTRLLIDSSVVIKWFHGEGETEVPQARAIRDAHVRGDVHAHVIDLAAYEIGNLLLMRQAAHLGEAHGLTFYDAAWASAAVGLDVDLVSADRRLLDAGLAASPTGTMERRRLRHA